MTLGCGGGHPFLRAPSWPGLAHLTRLTELTLRGYAFARELCEGRDRPPLPASLRALRLESYWSAYGALHSVARPQLEAFDVVNLGALARGDARLTLADGALLSASCFIACCSLEQAPVAAVYGAAATASQQHSRPPGAVPQPTRQVDDGTHALDAAAANAAATARRPAARPVSGLPVGFGALELHVSRIRFTRSVTLPQPGPQDAARELCLFFGRAPASYRRFTVYWGPERPLRFHFSWDVRAKAWMDEDTQAECITVTALAQCMQDYAGAHNLSIAVAEEPANSSATVIRY